MHKLQGSYKGAVFGNPVNCLQNHLSVNDLPTQVSKKKYINFIQGLFT